MGGYVNSISIFDFNKLKNINIIDIRSIEKYNDNHIYGAKNIPANKLILNPDKYLMKLDKYYIYCQKEYKVKRYVLCSNQKVIMW